jgi:GNAT superfamily N-acetyltransferase
MPASPKQEGKSVMVAPHPTLLLPEWSAVLVTRDGSRLNVRPASTADIQDVSEFLKAVTAEDLRFRFLNAVTPSEALTRILTAVDHTNVENLLAFDGGDGRLTATAMVAVGSSPEIAEVALVVRSDLKGKGIGWALLAHACDYARARGFRRLECIEWSENRTAIALEQELGFRSRACPGEASLTILSKDLGPK